MILDCKEHLRITGEIVAAIMRTGLKVEPAGTTIQCQLLVTKPPGFIDASDEKADKVLVQFNLPIKIHVVNPVEEQAFIVRVLSGIPFLKTGGSTAPNNGETSHAEGHQEKHQSLIVH